MAAALESILCTRCGLCCNGSLFADIELAGPREAARMEFLGLDIEDDSLLLQPCRALKGTRCSVYAHRPKCCRTFECALLQGAKRGEISIPAALKKIDEVLDRVKRIHDLLACMPPTDVRLQLKERCLEAIALADETPAATPARARIAAELEAEILWLDLQINETFLHLDHATP